MGGRQVLDREGWAAPAAQTNLFDGGGQMGELMRRIDWSQTPVGPVELWPQSLKTALSVLLKQRTAVFIFWGPEHVQFYNDAYRPILGTKKHPAALGQRGAECWPEIWDIILPMVESAHRGASTAVEDGLLVIDRNGYLEEGYYTYTYSPIAEESGAVGGVFCVVYDTTARVIGERRLRTLHDLASRTIAHDAEEACRAAALTLAGNPHDVPFAAVYLYEEDRKLARLAGVAGTGAGSAASPEQISFDGENRSVIAQAASLSRAVEIADLASRIGTLPGGPWPVGAESANVLPLAIPGQALPAGFMVAGINPRKRLDASYRTFFELVAGQIATAIAEARAYEEERKRVDALAALDRARLLLGAIVDSSDDAIVSKDLNGVIASWNKSAERLFGYTAEEVIGKSITIIIPPDRLSEEPEILRRIRSGERMDHFETIRRRKDGALLEISVTISPIRDANGNVIGASKIARDIRARKRAEEALRQSEARFRELAEAGPQFIWVCRPDRSVEYVNQRWIDYSGLHLSQTLRIGPLARAIHPEERAQMLACWQDSLASGKPLEMEARLAGRDDVFRWFVIHGVALKDDAGRVGKWFGVCTSIHEQKGVEEQLRTVNRDLEQFAYSASHDLQEPLRTVKIYSQLLADRHAGKLNGQALDFLEFVRGGASRMETLIRDLLAYTQISTVEIPPETADANGALQEALESLGPALDDSGARSSSDPLPSLRMHGTHLKQLFQNLIGNAIKYRQRGRAPEVHVHAEKRGGHWIFSVRDNGIGIEPEYKERIFGLFKRLHTGEEYAGTGIGLAICQRIVERYHGRIWVESEPGKGSTFRFTVPV